MDPGIVPLRVRRLPLPWLSEKKASDEVVRVVRTKSLGIRKLLKKRKIFLGGLA